MKIEKLLGKAKKDLKTDSEALAVEVLKSSLLDIESAKKTLRKLEKSHKILLKTDIDELELNGFEY